MKGKDETGAPFTLAASPAGRTRDGEALGDARVEDRVARELLEGIDRKLGQLVAGLSLLTGVDLTKAGG